MSKENPGPPENSGKFKAPENAGEEGVLKAADKLKSPEEIGKYRGDIKSFVSGLLGARGYREADDITSEVMLQAVEKLKDLQKPGSIRAWLLTTARRKVFDFQRTQIRQKRLHELAIYDPGLIFKDLATNRLEGALARNEQRFFDTADSQPDPEKQLSQKQAVELLNHAIAGLNKNQRKIIQLYYFDNLKIDEIMSALKLSENSVKTRLFRARVNLKSRLKKLQPGLSF